MKRTALLVLCSATIAWASSPLAAGSSREEGRTSRPESIDELFLRIGREVPEFGGAFVDHDSRLAIWSRAGSEFDAGRARDLLHEYSWEFGDAEALRVLTGDYSFSQLADWRDRLRSTLMGEDGALRLDIDETLNRIVVGVSDVDMMEQTVLDYLRAQSVPSAAVDIVAVEPVEPLSSLQDFHRPVVGGLQIGVTGKFCTLGFNAVRQGVHGFVTNSHCTLVQGGVEDTVFHQPTELLGVNRIGVEIRDPTYKTGGNCPSGKKCRWSDSAFAAYDSGVPFDRGKVALASHGTQAWNGLSWLNIWSKGDPVVGLFNYYRKIGRTTGMTSGAANRTCVDTAVAGSNLFLYCQTFSSIEIGPGDSGSPVLSLNDVWPSTWEGLVGLMWGATSTESVLSPMSGIQRSAELGSLTVCHPSYSC